MARGATSLHHFRPGSRGGRGTNKKFADNLKRLLVSLHRAWHNLWWNLRFLEVVFMLAVLEDKQGRLRMNYLLQRHSGDWQENGDGELKYVPIKDTLSQAWETMTGVSESDPVRFAESALEHFERVMIRTEIREQLGITPGTTAWDDTAVNKPLNRVFRHMQENYRRCTQGKFHRGDAKRRDKAWEEHWRILWGASTVGEVILIRLPLLTLADGSLDASSLTRYKGNIRSGTKKQHMLNAWEYIAGASDVGQKEFLEAAIRYFDADEVRESIADLLNGRKPGVLQDRIRKYVHFFVGTNANMLRLKKDA